MPAPINAEALRTQVPANCCRFCNLGPSVNSGSPWNEPLWESESFLAVPSLGAMVPGWILIVPKAHVIALALLEKDLFVELLEFKERLTSILQQKFGPVWAFEHGPAADGRNAGCSVDHAHLHLVPIELELLALTRFHLPPDAALSEGGWTNCREAFEKGRDYLYLESPHGHVWVAHSNSLGSQIVRRAIASALGVGSEYDWKTDHRLEIVAQTIDHFSRRRVNTDVTDETEQQLVCR